MKKTDYSGLISKKPWSPIPMTLGEAKELAYANEQNKKWLPLPKPGLLERLIGPCAYRSIRDFVRSVPYWKWRPCNRGCFLTCKGHVDAGVSNNQIDVKFECRHSAAYPWHNNGGALIAARDARALGVALLNETGNIDCLIKKHRRDD